MRVRLTKDFTFEAAQTLPCAPEGHKCRRMHGHSFYAEVTLRGEPDPDKGWVRDFTEVNAALGEIRGELDHQLLNDIAGLGTPTLERHDDVASR